MSLNRYKQSRTTNKLPPSAYDIEKKTVQNAKYIRNLEKIINNYLKSPIHPSKIKIAGTYDCDFEYISVDSSNNTVYKKDKKAIQVIEQLENPIFFTLITISGGGRVDNSGNIVPNTDQSKDKELGLIYQSNNKILARTVGTDADNGNRLLYDIIYDDNGLVTEYISTYYESGTDPAGEQHPAITRTHGIRRI